MAADEPQSLAEELSAAADAPWFDGSKDEYDASRLRALLRRAAEVIVRQEALTTFHEEVALIADQAFRKYIDAGRRLVASDTSQPPPPASTPPTDLVINAWSDPESRPQPIAHWLESDFITICRIDVESPGTRALRPWWFYADEHPELYAAARECGNCRRIRAKRAS